MLSIIDLNLRVEVRCGLLFADLLLTLFLDVQDQVSDVLPIDGGQLFSEHSFFDVAIIIFIQVTLAVL